MSTAAAAVLSGRCKHCGHAIVRYSSLEDARWFTPLGEQPPPGVALGIECPARRLEGTTFDYHEPR